MPLAVSEVPKGRPQGSVVYADVVRKGGWAVTAKTRRGKRLWDDHVVEVDIADARELVVPEHGVDGFRQLRAALLIDAAGIYPQPVEAVLLGKHTALPDLPRRPVARALG